MKLSNPTSYATENYVDINKWNKKYILLRATIKRENGKVTAKLTITITICNVYYKTEKVARNSYY